MKIWSTEHIFGHTWEQITMAAWQKYPNPMNPNVVGTDVLERHVDDRGVLHSHRLLTTAKWSVPRFVTSFLGIDEYCHVYEYSTVDPKSKLMTLRSVNLSLSGLMTVHETLKYQQHPDNSEKTLLTQEARIDATSLLGAPGYFEGLVADGFTTNAAKGREAIEWVCKKINTEMQDFAAGAQSFVAGMGLSQEMPKS
ncbi:PRELI domain containing protein 3B-like [Corticium candelabrum]|uniref:PRELI domain containing protein 3B-like n=1 Tax=Corticium candelabrum TaxID=121492 RepID=UPI002E274BEF|nr:PRELI domain containing protein 3B-like [Corticium candelabrum]